MTTTNTTPVTEIELTRTEQWAVHAAFRDYVAAAERDDTPLPEPSVEIPILEKVEAGEFAFTAFELDRLRHECEHHAESEYAPEIDREPARSVVDRIESRCGVELSR